MAQFEYGDQVIYVGPEKLKQGRTATVIDFDYNEETKEADYVIKFHRDGSKLTGLKETTLIPADQ